ncbi:MAG: RNA polymerase sigma factor [Myxococcota bacterium]
MPAARTDDDDAFERALADTATPMMALCTRLLGDADDAADALQEAWLRAFRHRAALQTPEALRGWLRVICVRECMRALRWRAVRRWFGVATLPDPPDPGPGPEGAAARAELARRVRLAVDALPARQRLVWGLRFDEGWTLPEIAEAAGLSPETVKTHLARATARVSEATRGL